MSADDKKPIDMPDSLAEAERFKRLFVDPAVEAMAARIELHLQPIVNGQKKLFAQLGEHKGKIDAHESAIDDLKKTNKKALIGWGVYATGIGLAGSAAWGWIKSKIHLG